MAVTALERSFMQTVSSPDPKLEAIQQRMLVLAESDPITKEWVEKHRQAAPGCEIFFMVASLPIIQPQKKGQPSFRPRLELLSANREHFSSDR
jgi:hypothetical protein